MENLILPGLCNTYWRIIRIIRIIRDTGCGKTYNTYYSEFQSDIWYDLCRWENEWTSERFLETSMTWILMKFCQIIEGSHSFSSKKTASKSERYISVSKAFKIAYFCPYNPYFSVHFCHKILRGGSRILPATHISRSKEWILMIFTPLESPVSQP